ncbi:hypothetical protein V8E54_014854 [Elaphomyces granulatus]
MQSMHRQFGKLMKRSADETLVSVLLKDFDQADKLLTRIIDSMKAWRDAWSSILSTQYRLLSEFESMYTPIVGSSDPSATRPVGETPPAIMRRTRRLREEYDDLRQDLLEEVNAIDDRMIRPAMQAKDFIQPLKKTIKKREDKKLDFERYQGRVDNGRKKTKRSDRENASLARAEIDLAKAKEVCRRWLIVGNILNLGSGGWNIKDYHAADEHIRQCLPPLIAATFAILPYLLTTQIKFQNSLLGHYYTLLHNYCEQEQFPSPPPAMDQVIQAWEADFRPVQQDVESLGCLAQGRRALVRPPMRDDHRNGSHADGARGPSHPRPGSRGSGGASSQSPGRHGPPEPAVDPPWLRDPAPPSPSTRPCRSAPTASIPESSEAPVEVPSGPAYAPAAPRADHFNRDRSFAASASASASASAPGSVVGKKKPPPPPPSNRLFVTAQYDFGGQGPGDLAFREGDRIRVLKKTESTDDWWEGELRGVKGSFPANYCG